MEYSNDADNCQNPSPCPARQYMLCPHCSFHLCFEHGQQHHKQIQHEILSLRNRAQHLENILNGYQPVQLIIDEVFHSLNEWKQKMHRFIDHYSEQIQMHIEQARNRLNDQWKTTKEEYLQMLGQFIRDPLHQLLKVQEQIHPDEVREIDTRLTNVQDQINNLFACRDLLRINFDSCSLTGDINISRGHFPSPTIQSFRSFENLPQLNRLHLLYRLDGLSTDTSALGVSPSFRLNNSSQIVVTYAEPSALIVFDTEHGPVKHIDVEPPFLSVHDIIWCDHLNLFLIAGAGLHTFDMNTNEIKDIFTPADPHIWSITTSRTDVYICYVMGQSSLIEHRSLPSFRLIQTYTRSQVLPTNSPSTIEIARCIRTNNDHIAMTVRDLTTFQWRVDIFDFHLQRLFKGQIIGHAAHPDYWCCLLTSYRTSSWLVINNTSKEQTLTLIDEEARMRQQIEHQGFNIGVLQDEQRLVVKDQQGLAIFRI